MFQLFGKQFFDEQLKNPGNRSTMRVCGKSVTAILPIAMHTHPCTRTHTHTYARIRTHLGVRIHARIRTPGHGHARAGAKESPIPSENFTSKNKRFSALK